MKCKYLFSVTLALSTIVSALAGSLPANANFWVNTDGTTVTIVNSSSATGVITIPETFDFEGNTFTVTAIGESAFAGSSITRINLPNTLTSIGEKAFYECSSLEKVDMPETLSSLGAYAFFRCYSLKHIIVPEGIDTLYALTFGDCTGLTSATLPSSLHHIGDVAFDECSSLVTVDLPENLLGIGRYSFRNCSSLKSVTIPSSVTMIDGFAFVGCNITDFVIEPSENQLTLSIVALNGANITNITFGRNWVYTPDVAASEGYCWPFEDNTSLTKVSLGEMVTLIPMYGFYECSTLSTIEWSQNITFILPYTFYGCSSLRSIYIPNKVNGISKYAFAECSSLERVTIPDATTLIDESCFENCNLSYVDIGMGMEKINKNAFAGNSISDFFIKTQQPPLLEENSFTDYSGTLHVNNYDALEAYSNAWGWCDFENIVRMDQTVFGLPDGVDGTFINDYSEVAIFGLPNVKGDIVIPETIEALQTNLPITEVMASGFQDATELTSMSLPNNMRYIGESAFKGSGLKSIHIGTNIENVGKFAFADTHIESVSVDAIVPPVADDDTFTDYSGTLYVVSEAAKNAYSVAPCWRNFTKVEVRPAGVDNVYDNTSSPVRYYNLQGVEIADPSDGIFIIRQGNKTAKVIR